MRWRDKASAAELAAAEEKRNKLKALSEKIAAMSEPELQAFADKVGLIMTTGHPVSPRNTMLAYMQVEQGVTLSQIGGFKQWLEVGRLVRKGKSISITAPSKGKAKDKEGNVKKAADGSDVSRTFFKPIAVWDISETDPMSEEEIEKYKARKQKEMLTSDEEAGELAEV